MGFRFQAFPPYMVQCLPQRFHLIVVKVHGKCMKHLHNPTAAGKYQAGGTKGEKCQATRQNVYQLQQALLLLALALHA
jgi:hypothetical protein